MKYKVTQLEEDSILRIANLKIGFEQILPPSTNYIDSHGLLPSFNLLWGRGVLTKSPSGYNAIIGKYGTSHAQLKKALNNNETTKGTFYYGFDKTSSTLFFEYASDTSGIDFNNQTILTAIINALKESNTPFHNMRVGK